MLQTEKYHQQTEERKREKEAAKRRKDKLQRIRDIEARMEAETVQGSTVTIDLDNGVMVEEASVVTADVEASNGVIHVIDKVILPEG